MKIISLKAENIKRLQAVEITPDGNMVEITGANGAGKTSVLDSIWWAICGTKTHQGKPIREGETIARITLDMGDVIVKREFKDKDGKILTSLKVMNADGSVFTSPQKMLDALLGSLSFDPLAFSRMQPKEQYKALTELCELDFDELEALNKKDYDKRTMHNRIAAENQIAADLIELDDGEAQARKIDVTDLHDQQKAAIIRNSEISSEHLKRQAKKDELNTALEVTQATVQDLENGVREHESMIKNIENKIKSCKTNIADTNALIAQHKDIEPLDEIQNIDTFNEKIVEAEASNRLFYMCQEKSVMLAVIKAERKKSDQLTNSIDNRKKKAVKAIQDAEMPVEGLGLDNGIVTLKGIPFDQASDAEQLRISCAMAMKGDHKLKVIRVRDGSLLDDSSMRILSDMADKEGYQVWIERVDTSGKVGFVIEDGMLKQ